MMNTAKFTEKGWLYLWHKDNTASINPEDVKTGDMMYISMQLGLECDGYDGTVGKPEDFKEKLYVEYEWEIGKTELMTYKNEDGELDTCEACWAEIINIIDINDEIDAMVVHDIDLSEEEYEMLLEDEELCDEFFEELLELY